MMKRFGRYVCLLLVIALLLPVAVMAIECREADGTYSLYFISVNTALVRGRWRTLQIGFDVSARNIMIELGVKKIELQKSTDQENWTTIKTFLPEDYPEMLCENTGSHTGTVSCTGTEGYYHRAKVTYYAKNSSGFGEYVHYSNIVSI